MSEIIVVFMVIVFCIGMGIVIKDAVQHSEKDGLMKGPDRRS